MANQKSLIRNDAYPVQEGDVTVDHSERFGLAVLFARVQETLQLVERLVHGGGTLTLAFVDHQTPLIVQVPRLRVLDCLRSGRVFRLRDGLWSDFRNVVHVDCRLEWKTWGTKWFSC